MTPHLVKWDKRYRSKGLTVLDINSGRMDKQPALAKYIKQHKKTYPTLWDKLGKLCRDYGVRGYPAGFLIGVDGKVVWEGFPVPELKTLEQRIVKELGKIPRPAKKQVGGSAKGKTDPQRATKVPPVRRTADK